jgi:hypothetical protein
VLVDTFAWRNGAFDLLAVQSAVEPDPEDPLIGFHFALALGGGGNVAGAATRPRNRSAEFYTLVPSN